MRTIIAVFASALVLGLAVLLFIPETKPAAGAAGPSITLFSGENFTGRSVTLTRTAYDMPKEGEGDAGFDWNDQVRSIIVNSGTFRIYQHGRCNTKLDKTSIASFTVRSKEPTGGWSGLVSGLSSGPLAIPNLGAFGLFRDVSSIELVSEKNLPDWAMSLRK